MGNFLSCVGGKSNSTSLNHHEKLPLRRPAGDEPDGGDASTSKYAAPPNDSYEARMRIDDEILVERFRHRMTDSSRRRLSATSDNARRQSSSGRAKVTFRAESFDSQASTESQRLEFRMQLIDSLPETFLDEVDVGEVNNGDSPPEQLLVSALVVNQEAEATEESNGAALFLGVGVGNRPKVSRPSATKKYTKQASFNNDLETEPSTEEQPPEPANDTILLDELNA